MKGVARTQWKFVRRGGAFNKSPHWLLYRVAVLPDGRFAGSRLEAAEVRFAKKENAREWARGRCTLERIEYVEYKKPPRPPPAPPLTPLQAKSRRVNQLDAMATRSMESGYLSKALEMMVLSAEECMQMIPLDPGRRERLNAAARSRVRVARDIFDEWERSLAIPPPLLKLLN